MLSYRHSFHAGNFADVLKHLVLIELLGHLTQKDKAIHYIDTHAGAGLFDLRSDHALKLEEYNNGIGKLLELDWPELATYRELIDSCNEPGKLAHYPGSPLIALRLLRSQDRAWLYELHPEDCKALARNTRHDKRARVMLADGLRGLLGLLPPVSRRGLILVDPPYEVKSDYRQVVQTVCQAYRKFATGTYALWYPVVERSRIEQMQRDFVDSRITNIQQFELNLTHDTLARGMTGAGMIVINPPWTLMAKMTALLPRLVPLLGADDGAGFRCDTLVPEQPG